MRRLTMRQRDELCVNHRYNLRTHGRCGLQVSGKASCAKPHHRWSLHGGLHWNRDSQAARFRRTCRHPLRQSPFQATAVDRKVRDLIDARNLHGAADNRPRPDPLAARSP